MEEVRSRGDRAYAMQIALPTMIYTPSGAKRLKQYAQGMLATIVAGEVVLKDNQHTGALPGQLLRGPLFFR